ncbi:MAG: hypothetical protein ABI765_06985 [Gemmatimonadota bacterium]
MLATLSLLLLEGWIFAFSVLHVTALAIHLLPLAAAACLIWHLWSANRPVLPVER